MSTIDAWRIRERARRLGAEETRQLCAARKSTVVVEVVGREIGVELEGVTADLTVEVAARDAARDVAPTALGNRVEAPDKHQVRLRVDRRDAREEPTVVCLESAAGRQLAAALVAAADRAEDLVPVTSRRLVGEVLARQ